MTMILNEQEPVLPTLSETEQPTNVTPRLKFAPLVALQNRLLLLIPEPESEGTAVKVATAAGAPREVLTTTGEVGQPGLGAVISIMSTVKMHVRERLALSTAVHERWLRPNGNVLPEVELHTVLLIPDPSVAVTENVAAAPRADVAFRVKLGQVNEGAVESETDTQNEQLAELPMVSWAEQTTVWFPRENLEPEAGVQEEDLIPEGSVTVGLNALVTYGTPAEGVSLIGRGQVSCGGVVSVLVTVNEQLAERAA